MRRYLDHLILAATAIAAGFLLAIGPTPPAEPATLQGSNPVYLNVDPDMDLKWGVTETADAWNTATGCHMFTLNPADAGDLTYWVYEVPDLAVDDVEIGGHTVWPWVTGEAFVVELNPEWVTSPGLFAHEAGHILGVDHTDESAGVMSGVRRPKDAAITANEAEAARQANPSRCN